MTGAGIRQLAVPMAGWALPVGLVIMLIVLLNRRDRRRAELLDLVSGQFDSTALRSNVAISINAGLLSESSSVIVDMPDCSQEEAQEAFARLSKMLPPQVGLVVRGAPRSLGKDRRSLARAKALSAPAVRVHGSLGSVAAARGHGG
jgi:hypothetical protein